MVPIIHSVVVVLAIADPHQDLRQKVGLWEEISEDAVVVRQSTDVERSSVLLPGVLHSIQGNLDYGWMRMMGRQSEVLV